MLSHKGKKFCNAETCIDLEKKKVRFSYPSKKYNENLCFFFHNFYFSFGLIIGVICWYRLTTMWLASYGYSLDDLRTIFRLVFALSIFLFIVGGGALFGYISLLIHKFSKSARDAYPKTSAINIMKLIPKDKSNKINLEHKISKVHYIDGKKLIIFNYDIVLFNYCYIGCNKIKKIITKSVDYNAKNDHHEFIAIFLFEKKIKDGVLIYNS